MINCIKWLNIAKITGQIKLNFQERIIGCTSKTDYLLEVYLRWLLQPFNLKQHKNDYNSLCFTHIKLRLAVIVASHHTLNATCCVG